MRIRFRQSIASASWDFAAGDVAEVPDALAKIWLRSGVAEAAPGAEVGRAPAQGCERCGEPTGGDLLCPSCLVRMRDAARYGGAR